MNDSEDLLAQLGALEREYDDAFPHEWEDVVRGQRTAEEVIEAREGRDDPEELHALAKELRPLDAATRDAWVERLAATLGAHDGAGAEGEPEPGPEPEADVVDLDARRRARLGWISALVGVLAAAALVLWLRPSGEGPHAPQGVALPSFGLTVRNETVHDVRRTPAPSDAVDRYQPGSRIHWVIRPERSVAPPLGLRVLAQAVAPEGVSPPRRLLDPGPVEVSPRGVLELQGTLGDALGLPPGRWSLRMVVGEPAALPGDLAELDRGGAWVVSEPYVIDVVP